jgi:hypothetical protein
VQIHAHDLTAVIRCLHWGLPITWWRRMLGNFQHPPGSGRLRSFIASRTTGWPGQRCHNGRIRRFASRGSGVWLSPLGVRRLCSGLPPRSAMAVLWDLYEAGLLAQIFAFRVRLLCIWRGECELALVEFDGRATLTK